MSTIGSFCELAPVCNSTYTAQCMQLRAAAPHAPVWHAHHLPYQRRRRNRRRGIPACFAWVQRQELFQRQSIDANHNQRRLLQQRHGHGGWMSAEAATEPAIGAANQAGASAARCLQPAGSLPPSPWAQRI